MKKLTRKIALVLTILFIFSITALTPLYASSAYAFGPGVGAPSGGGAPGSGFIGGPPVTAGGNYFFNPSGGGGLVTGPPTFAGGNAPSIPGMPGIPGAPGGLGSGANFSPFIQGTLVKIPTGMNAETVFQNFDPSKLGLQIPDGIKPADFAQFLEGKGAMDFNNIEMIKGLNPGKLGPMNNPTQFSSQAGFSFDPTQGFKLNAPQNLANPELSDKIFQAMDVEKAGKFRDAVEMIKPLLQQQPDALLQAYAANLDLKAGLKNEAMLNIEKAIAMSPKDPNIFAQAGKIYKDAGVQGPKVFVNGVKPEFDVKPFVEKNRTLVPFRALAETMGAQVQWDEKTKKITMIRGGKTVVMTLGSKTALVDGKPVTMDVAPKTVNSRTVVPLRFMGEGLNTDVSYDQDTEIIKVMPK